MVDMSLEDRSDTDVLADLSRRLDENPGDSGPFPVFQSFFEDNFGLELEGLGLASRSDWLSVYPSSFNRRSEGPDYDQLLANESLSIDGEFWYPIQDHLGLVGAFVFHSDGLTTRQKRTLDSIGPSLLSYFRRLEHYESASGREELSFPDRELLHTGESSEEVGLEEIFRSSVQSIFQIFECDNCRLFWLESPEILRLRAEIPTSEDLDSELMVSNDPVIEQVVRDGKSIMINDLPEAEETLQQSGNIRSFLSVPISFSGQIKGAINLSSQAPDVYTKQDLQRFTAFCDHLSTVYSTTQDLVDLTNYVDKVMRNLPVGVMTYRINRDEIHLNTEAQDIMGLDDERIDREDFERHMEELSFEGKFTELLEIDETLGEHGPREYKLEDERSDTPRIVKAYRNSIRDSENLLSGILVVVSEITEQVRLNEQVNRTERLAALGELASGLAHEIKNPLTSMHGFVQMLPERSDDQDFVEKTADILDRECKRLDELIENLHSYAKPQVGQRQEFELKELIEETLTLLRKEAEKSDVELKTEVPDGTKVFGDPSKIKQVIMNLSLNGIEAMRDGGVLQISCERTRDDYVRMKIQDEGVGMEEDELERIFNPFYTTKEDGTGLGMSISHRIVEDHGGLLRFDSAPEQGTTAEVLFPRQESSPPIERSSYLGE